MEFIKFHKGLDRGAFCCGEPGLDAFFKEQATSYIKRGLCSIYVLIDEENIVGFYSLSSSAIQPTDFPPEIIKKYPQNLLIPCWIIDKLAIDKKYQGKGLGEAALLEALQKVLRASREFGGYCVVIDAKNEQVKGFYQKYGLKPFLDNELRLYLPIASLLLVEP